MQLNDIRGTSSKAADASGRGYASSHNNPTLNHAHKRHAFHQWPHLLLATTACWRHVADLFYCTVYCRSASSSSRAFLPKGICNRRVNIHISYIWQFYVLPMEAADSTTPGPPPVNGEWVLELQYKFVFTPYILLLVCAWYDHSLSSIGRRRLFSWLPSWKPTSEQQLVESERVVLKAGQPFSLPVSLTNCTVYTHLWACMNMNIHRPILHIISPCCLFYFQVTCQFYVLFSYFPISFCLSSSLIITEVKDEYTDSYIPVGDTSFVRTLTMPPSDATKSRTPLVMMHGFGCGLGAFSQNFDGLHKDREVLALDVLGFGRSSRTPFTPEAEQAENELVDSLERWRQGIGLDKFVLLGHSFGAFLACSYAMRYPMRVKHLILVDPWGFSTRPAVQSGADRKIPAWASVVGLFLTHFNPLTALRVAGPLGKSER